MCRMDAAACMLFAGFAQVFQFQRGPGKLTALRSSEQHFSFCTSSPGFRLLVSVLSSSKFKLGWVAPQLPNIPQLGQRLLPGSWQLLRRGSTTDGSYVYLVEPPTSTSQASTRSEDACVVKLNRSDAEVWSAEGLIPAHVDSGCAWPACVGRC